MIGTLLAIYAAGAVVRGVQLVLWALKYPGDATWHELLVALKWQWGWPVDAARWVRDRLAA